MKARTINEVVLYLTNIELKALAQLISSSTPNDIYTTFKNSGCDEETAKEYAHVVTRDIRDKMK